MLYIHLLGYLRLFSDELPLQFRARPRVLDLWVYLLLNRARPVSREPLAFLLWPDVPEATAQANLRRHLHGLRQALPPASQGRPWLLLQPGTVQWNPAADCWLDVAEFERLSTSPEHLARAAALYTGDLLPELYADWIVFDREHLRGLYLDCLGRLIAQSRVHGDLPRAIAYAHQSLAHDALQEGVVRELIALRYQAGDRAGAIEDYQRFAVRLLAELGTAPMPETLALYEAVCQNRPLPRHTPPPAAAGSPRPCPHNLPASVNPFFGREAELQTIPSLLAADSAPVRLLTLTGPAGVGKTRLALEAATRMLPNQAGIFPDGIFFVDLTAVTDPALVLPAIAAAVGVKESGRRPLVDALKEWLRPRHILLLLDNLEQVTAAGPLIADLLAAAPNLRLLATSRSVLQLYGEHEYPLAPLPLPNLEQQPSPQELQGNAAVALFAARAQERRPDFTLTAQNAVAVAEICVRLDGLPLAVELAARQVKTFSPADILTRLARRLEFLEGGPCDRPARHQTLRGALEWSYRMLTTEEQRLFAALGVFAGGCTRPAVEAICGPACGGDVGKGLATMVNHSLLWRVGEGDEPRFGMLQSIREYALELLGGQDLLATMAQRHADYFTELAEQAHAERSSPRLAAWMQWMDAELDNLRAAMAWGLDPAADAARAVAAVRLVLALSPDFWQHSGRLSEGLSWCVRALRHRPWLDDRHCAELLIWTGWLGQLLGDYAAAEAHCQEALVLARQSGNRQQICKILDSLGIAAGRQGDYERAEALLSEAIAMSQEDSGGAMTHLLASLLNNLAIVTRHQGDPGRAMSLLQESLAYKRAGGDHQGVAISLVNLGNLAQSQGDYAAAQAAFRESLQIRQALGDKSGTPIALEALAELALCQGQYVRSARLHSACAALHEALGLPLLPGPREQTARQIAALRELLGEADFAAAWALGASLAPEQVVEYAME